ncbi:MAG: MTH938/NDUFAF3 family protein, partial [Rhodanobacteraceae bacterium]
GARQRFPSQEVLAAFLQRGVGVEVMDNAAAARTWDILASEGRNAVAVFVLADQSDSQS